MTVELETFQSLPTPKIAQLVRQTGAKICVFPINGTRRWFMLEHKPTENEDPALAYLDLAGRRHIELYQMFFDHGLDTLLTPVFGPDLLERGAGYIQMAVEGLAGLANQRVFLDFYNNYDVRVRFYGDYVRFLNATPHTDLIDQFDRITTETANHSRHRLFFGLFAHDATESVAEIVVRFYQAHGRSPTKREIVQAYYGEYVEAADLFIGFDKLAVFDMPLVTTGNEDLYFTVSPSPYLTEQQLRHILYDHLYSRKQGDPDYETMGSDDWTLMHNFYQANRGKTLGVGATQKHGGFWYPRPQIELPTGFE